MPCPFLLPTIALPLLLALSVPADRDPGPPAATEHCEDSATADGAEACTEPSETFLLQVVLQVQPQAGGNGSLAPGGEARRAAGQAPEAGNESAGGAAAAEEGAPWYFPFWSTPGSKAKPSESLLDAQEDYLRSLSALDLPESVVSFPMDMDFPDLHIPNHHTRARDPVVLSKPSSKNATGRPVSASSCNHSARISKRVFIILEMVPASAILGLDRLYLCDGCPFEGRDAAKCGRHCYLGFLKLMISALAFLHTSRLIPLAMIWWFIDAGFVIDNCVRGEDSINNFGMVAHFQESSVEEARKLSLAAAGQFGLELALFLPAIFALLLGSEPRSTIHRRIQDAIENLRRVPRGASEAAIESTTSTVLHQAGKPGNDNEDVCSICCDVFQEKDKLRVLPCKHRFHAACVDRWLTLNCTCPLCKGDITCGGQQQPEESGRWHDARWQQVMASSVHWRTMPLAYAPSDLTFR